jgi:PBSX family phage portal protein
MADGDKSNGSTKVQVHLVGKAATNPFSSVIVSNAWEVEDEWQQFYEHGSAKAIRPPLPLRDLELWVQKNNSLAACIDAMEANIDGTGYSIDGALTDEEPNEEEVKRVEEFFHEPFPGMSFTTIRRKVRRDLEITGNGYLEVMRTPQDELAFVRHVSASTIRLVKLDEAVPVEKVVVRGGREVAYTVMTRQRLPSEQRATELIHLVMKDDAETPYGVPRWVNQIPSVVGSRKAEEHNLEYFDSGGIPPVLMMVQGGQLAPQAVEALEKMFSGKTKDSHRAAILEAHSTSGSIDAVNNVRVTVERFGSERLADSMFENYDKRCEERIRSSFRLPPLFVGKAQDYSFATAFASYTVAEAQVFQPERQEFDEVINVKLLPELGVSGLKFRSLPLSVKDSTLQLQALELAGTSGAIDKEEFIETLNEVVNLALKPIVDEVEERPEMGEESEERVVEQGGIAATGVPSGAVKMQASDGLVALAYDVARAMKQGVSGSGGAVELKRLMKLVASLSRADTRVFNSLLSAHNLVNTAYDPSGLDELTGCAFSAMTSQLN